MLVICNGAIKNGSTWLYNILANLATYAVLDEKYLTGKNPKHPCIRPEKLIEFIEREDIEGRNYLTKNHLNDRALRDFLLARDQVFIFDIERDPKDVVVSNYYHNRFRNGYTGSFEEFYWQIGRELAAGLNSYHEMWRNAGPRSYVSTYEQLHEEFEQEVMRIAVVMGVSLDDADLKRIKERTTLDNLRKEYAREPRFEGEKFFRKGATGDWKNHFGDDMLVDINRIMNHGIGAFDMVRIQSRLKSLLAR